MGKKGRKIPSPPPHLSFIFWLSFHFSRGQNRKSRSSSFFAPKPKALYDFWSVYKVDNQGPVSRKVQKLFGPKANFRIKTGWIVAQFLAQKPDSLLQSLTDSFNCIIFKIEGKHETAFPARKVIGTFERPLAYQFSGRNFQREATAPRSNPLPRLHTIFGRKVTPIVYLPLKNDAFLAHLSKSSVTVGRGQVKRRHACRHFYSNVREYQERGWRLLAWVVPPALGGSAIEAKYLKDTYGVLLFIIILYR